MEMNHDTRCLAAESEDDLCPDCLAAYVAWLDAHDRCED